MKELKLFMQALANRLNFKNKFFTSTIAFTPFNIPAYKKGELTIYLITDGKSDIITTLEKVDRVVTEEEKREITDELVQMGMEELMKIYGI